MPRRLGLAGGLVALSLAVLSAVPPQAQQAPPFRAGTTLINVDVYPRRNGQVVEGLTAADFEVLEDGVPQKVDAFEFIRVDTNTPEAERRDPRSKAESDQLAADPHNRLFVIYFDIFHSTFEGAHLTRQPVLDFLSRTISATDLFGVMTPETDPSRLVFGRQTTTIERELSNSFEWGLRNRQSTPIGRTPMEEQLQTCMTGRASLLGDGLVALYREDLMMTNLEQLMGRLSGLRDGRKSILFMSEGWTPQPPATAIALATSGQIPTIGTGRGGTLTTEPMRTTTGRSVSWCDQQALRLGNIDFYKRYQDLLTLANRANVSFYTVNIGGLQTPMPPLNSRRSMSLCGQNNPECTRNDQVISQMLARLESPDPRTLRELSDNTDGMAIFNTNDLGAGFRRIADDLSAYYMLGYASTNQKADGRFRRIEVRVKQPGLNISARRGYLAPSAEAMAVGAAANAAAAANAPPAPVTAELDRLSRLRPAAELFSYAFVRDDKLHVAVEISSQEMARGRWTSGADVEVSAAGASGAPLTGRARIDAGARGTTVEMALQPGTPGPWRTSLRVSQGTAELTDRLEIPVPSGSAILSAPLMFRGAPAPRAPMRAVADFQLRRNERLRVEWPVHEALDERTARLLDRRGVPMPIPATVTEVDTPAGRVVNVDVNLAPLAEGDYLVELTAGKSGQTERGLLAFRVVR
jgi:VWFA-related protein